MQEQDKLLRADQAARKLGVTDQHVRRLGRQGKLKREWLSERNIRFLESDVDAYQQRLEENS